MSSSYRLELDRWLANLDVKADCVVDIGGAQLPVKGRTKSWDVKDYQIWDLEEPHVDSVKPDVTFDLEDEVTIPMVEADVVFCLEVFEYIVEPLAAMENISLVMSQTGTAYISFPFIYPTHQPLAAEGLRYTENGVRRLAELAHLEVVELIPRRPETNLLQQFYSAERMRAAKGYDHAVIGWIGTFQRLA